MSANIFEKLPPGMYYGPRGKIFGRLHESGKNRHQRRAEATIECGIPEAYRIRHEEDLRDIRKEAIAKRVAKQHAAAHQRALTRHEMASGKPRLITRAREALRIRSERIAAEKKTRNARYKATHTIV